EEKQHFQQGYTLMRQDCTDKAIMEFTKVLEINPANAWGLIELGKLHRNKQEFAKAEELFKQSLQIPLNEQQKEQAHVCLGEIYRLQGKYSQAHNEFLEALVVNPENQQLRDWLIKSGQVRGIRKETAPYKVFLTWGMHYQCNYRCRYCYAPKPEKECFNEQPKNVASYLSVAQWVKIWEGVYKKYGPCRIRMDGGEPSAYPGFLDLVEQVSQYHDLQINTNLSFDVDAFVARIKPEKVRLDASLHLEYVSPDDFLSNIRILHAGGFKIVVSCVAYPPFIERINACKEPYAVMKIPFIIHPFSGEYEGKSYPKAYEVEEVAKIYSLDEASRLVMSWRKGEIRNTKGKPCRMGQTYARIYPNADAYRCCADGGMDRIGNLADEGFQLLDKALVCPTDNCPCWKSMVVGDEERWTSLWLDEWELPPLPKVQEKPEETAENTVVSQKVSSPSRKITEDINALFVLREKSQFEEAINGFEALRKKYPDVEAVQLELGKTYKMMNRGAEALGEFTELLRRNACDREALWEFGETSRMINRLDEATTEIEEVIKRSSPNDQAHIELSKIFQKKNDFTRAEEELKKALAISESNSEVYFCLGQLQTLKGEYESAITHFKKALALDPESRYAHLELAGIYQRIKEYPSAISEITCVKTLSPQDVQSRLKLVQLHLLNNEPQLAQQQAQEVLALRPGDLFFQDTILNEVEIMQKKTVIQSKVKRLWVTLTSRCNIKCRTCGLWSTPWDIPRKTVDEVIALYPYLERLVWLGGEVFLSEYFDEMFEKARVYPQLSQQVITNGVILTRRWIERILSAPNTELTFSVDGTTKEVYEYIRRGSNFEKLVTNIGIVNEVKKKVFSKTPLRLNAVIMKTNYQQLESFLEFAHEHGFCQVSVMALHFDEDPNENILYSHEDKKVLEYITEAVPRMRKKAREYNIDLDVLLPTSESKEEEVECAIKVNTPPSTDEAMYCKMPWKYMFICDKGTTYLTGSCAKPIGNIYKNSLDEIWNSPEAQHYRESMLKNCFEGICRPECRTRWEI
ncbi:MAG: tetratricopeptide repeat protein, partial [Candidatus Omnitrophica bacterium]|nr:tetratricopeptide repeat protein [Candidatus Omnitrophota bacterium]